MNKSHEGRASRTGRLSSPVSLGFRRLRAAGPFEYVPSENATPADALAITKALRTHGCVGRFPGWSPEEMLADIKRGRFTAEDFLALATVQLIDLAAPHRRIRGMLREAERFISRIPSDAVGVLFLQAGKPVEPDLNSLAKYHRHAGAPAGAWPSAPEIFIAMLERYKPTP